MNILQRVYPWESAGAKGHTSPRFGSLQGLECTFWCYGGGGGGVNFFFAQKCLRSGKILEALVLPEEHLGHA